MALAIVGVASGTASTPVDDTITVSLPAQSGTVTYNGTEQSPQWTNYDSAQLAMTGETAATNAGTYTVTFTPTGKCFWSNGTKTATTARAATTISLNENSVTLTVAAPTATITVTTNSDGEISATPADDSVCTASVNGNVVTIAGEMNGNTTVAIAVAQTDRYNASSTKTVSVSVPVALPINMLNGRTLAQVQQIFQSGQGANYFKAGDYFDMTFPSEITLDEGNIAADSTWRVVCLGIDHNSGKEGTKRGHFCIGKDTTGEEICFHGKQMNSTNTNSGGWNGSEMKTWLNGTFYNALPADLKGVITACTKYTANSSSSASSSVTATSQKIWLMAEFEVYGERTHANQYEQNSQTQYDYYKNGNSRMRHDHSSGSERGWWLRSPASVYHFCRVNDKGDAPYGSASYMHAVVPCFTIS